MWNYKEKNRYDDHCQRKTKTKMTQKTYVTLDFTFN
jgi:hypothetical protein